MMTLESGVDLVQELELAIVRELSGSVKPALDNYWTGVIKSGIVPAEAEASADLMSTLREEKLRLVNFEVELVKEISKGIDLAGNEAHYVGAGEGMGLRGVTLELNNLDAEVKAYDVSEVGCENARKAFKSVKKSKRLKHPKNNKVYHADVECACQPRYMAPSSARLLILVRVLEILNKPSGDPDKLMRVCLRIGRLLKYLKVFVIYPRPEKNQGVLFRNGKPEPFEEVVNFMEQGLERKAKVQVLSSIDHFRHYYTAHLIEAA